MKYPSRELVIEEEKLLYKFINNRQNNKQNFIEDVLSSCQILIDYIQKENYEQDKTLSSVIKELPEYIDLDETFKYFFINIGEKKMEIDNKNFKMFSINTLINIYNLIEFICWEQFKNNLNEQYRMPLSEENKRKIKACIDNSIKENNLIQKQDLASAVRRLISRYLSGKRGDIDIGEYQKLFDQIKREDLWKADISGNDNFVSELTDLFENKIKKEITELIKCNENNKCEWCEIKKNEEGEEEPCFECNKCKGELLIGHSLDFFELINEEVFNPDKFEINNETERNHIFNGIIDSNNKNEIKQNNNIIDTSSGRMLENRNNEIIDENEGGEEGDEEEDEDCDEI